MIGSSTEARVGQRAEQKRRWDRENRPTCSCGRRMWKRGVCKACVRERAEERERQIVVLRKRGLTNVEIARELHSTPAAIAQTIKEMRARGIAVAASPHFRAGRSR